MQVLSLVGVSMVASVCRVYIYYDFQYAIPLFQPEFIQMAKGALCAFGPVFQSSMTLYFNSFRIIHNMPKEQRHFECLPSHLLKH